MPKRAKLLYERGLISLDKDREFWLQYVRFLEKTMRDPPLVRAKYENRMRMVASSSGSSHSKMEVLELMLEQALFEEEQNSVPKARKIYENIQSEGVAPDCLKAVIAFLNFEKRQNNTEKVKELYFRAYSHSMSLQETEAVAYIVVQYARFLAFKCNDSNRAVELYNKALEKCASGSNKGSKTLYLSYVNFLKHLESSIPDSYSKVVQVFERGIDAANGMSHDDRSEIARFFLEYLQENCQSVSFLRSTEASLKAKQLLSTSNKLQQASR